MFRIIKTKLKKIYSLDNSGLKDAIKAGDLVSVEQILASSEAVGIDLNERSKKNNLAVIEHLIRSHQASIKGEDTNNAVKIMDALAGSRYYSESNILKYIDYEKLKAKRKDLNDDYLISWIIYFIHNNNPVLCDLLVNLLLGTDDYKTYVIPDKMITFSSKGHGSFDKINQKIHERLKFMSTDIPRAGAGAGSGAYSSGSYTIILKDDMKTDEYKSTFNLRQRYTKLLLDIRDYALENTDLIRQHRFIDFLFVENLMHLVYPAILAEILHSLNLSKVYILNRVFFRVFMKISKMCFKQMFINIKLAYIFLMEICARQKMMRQRKILNILL